MPIDRREDAGDFYLGGKVISTRPVATGGDVKHSDFAGLDVKTNTIPDLREAVRELGRRLGATVVTALSACVAIGATVQTVPINDLDFDANPSVVTNVTFEGLAQEGELESIRVAIASNKVAIASNADSISTVSNAAVHAAITNAADIAALETSKADKAELSGYLPLDSPYADFTSGDTIHIKADMTIDTGSLAFGADSNIDVTEQRGFMFSHLGDVSALLPDGSPVLTRNTAPVQSVNGRTGDVTLSAADVGAATPADVTAAIREQSLGGIWDAELEVWWTPRMKNGSLTYEATTNVNLNAVN